MRLSSFLAASALALALSIPTPALANGRFPAAQQLVPSPSDPSTFVLRTTFGLLFSKDEGASWDWVCEAAVGYDANEDPTMALTANQTVFAGAFKGMFASTDFGCTWTPTAGGLAAPVVDVAVRKDDPHSAVVLASVFAASTDAGSTFATDVWTTHDDGAHFAKLGAPLDPSVLVETIDVAPSDAQRLYVSGTTKDGTGAVLGVLLASTDGGSTWTRATFPLVPQVERAPYIAAVDPLDASRLYVRVKAVEGTRLLVSTDGGKTMSDVWKAQGDLLGFALSADGSKVYAGSVTDGLNVASKTDMTFARKSSAQIQCLAYANGTLYACSNDASGFVIGASSDDGATFAPLLHLCSVRGPLACSASSAVTTQCVSQWPAQQQALGAPCGAGGSDAGSGGDDAGATPTAPAGSRGSKGCALASPTPSRTAVLLVGALVAAGIARVRRRRQGGLPRR